MFTYTYTGNIYLNKQKNIGNEDEDINQNRNTPMT